MHEPEESEIRTLSIEEEVDGVQHYEIDGYIDSLNFASLSSFDANNELHSALNNDAFIINNVVTQIGIAKALEHGVKLSAIVKAKALRLNEATALELLDAVLRIYCKNFSFKVEREDDSQRDKGQTQDDEDDVAQRNLDFGLLSRYFSSKVISYSPLTWDTLPRVGCIGQPEEGQVKRKRTQIVHTSQFAPIRELETMEDYQESLETQKHTKVIRERLTEATAEGPVNFWRFVLDPDPSEGYTRTCLNIYALTFLTVKGFTEFSRGEDHEIMIQISEEINLEGENSQGIVSPLSYDKWLEMTQKYCGTK